MWHIDVESLERDLQANAGASVCDTEPSFSSEDHMGLKQHPNVLHHSVCDCCLKAPYFFPIFPLMSESLYRQRISSPVLKELLKPTGSHHTSAVSSASSFTLSNKSEMRMWEWDCVLIALEVYVAQVVIISISLKCRQVFFLSSRDVANYHPLECSCMFFVSSVTLIDR